MSHCKNKLVCFIAAMAVAYCTWAQSNFIVKHFNTENGLPQNSVLDIKVDAKGFAWLATENGLVRFDGQHFRNFNLGNTPALKNTDRMRVILADQAGNVFCRNANYDVYAVKSPNLISAIAPPNGNRAILAEPASVVLQNDFSRAFEAVKKQNPAIIDNFFQQSLYKINDNEIYSWADNSDICFLKKDGTGTRICANNVGRHFILHDTIFDAGTNGVFSVFYKNRQLKDMVLSGELTRDSLYEPTFSRLLFFKSNNNVVVKAGNNYYSLQKRNDSLYSEMIVANLKAPNVMCVYYDAARQQYLIGTRSDGFYLLKYKSFETILQPENNNGGEAVNVFGDQMLFDTDNILVEFGTAFDKRGKAFSSKPKLFSGGYNGVDGYIWYESDGYLHKADNSMRQLLRIPLVDHNGIRFILQDAGSKKVWCASPNSVFFVNQQAQKLEVLSSIKLTGEEITCLIPKDSNHLWLGTNNGLYTIQLQPYSQSKIVGSAGINVRFVLTDKENDIAWVASYGKGPCYIKNNQLYHLPVDKENKLLTPHCFIADAKGFLWMPTNHGLFQVLKKDWIDYSKGNRSEIYYQYYNDADGFASNEFNGGYSNAYVRRSDGLVSLASMKGLVWFVPEKVRPELPGNAIYIDQVSINEKPVEQPEGIKLSNNYSQFGAHVTTSFFGNKENLHLQYQVKGFDESWVNVPENYTVALSRLPHGKYELITRGQAGFGGRYISASLPFEVLPTWYQTVWFYILAGLVLLLIIWLVVRLRLSTLINRKKELEAEVASRTASLHDTVENYKQINNQLELAQEQLLEGDKTKEEMIAIILHDLWSPLKFIAETSASIIINKDKYTLEECFKYLANLSASSSNILQLTDQLLKWMRSQHGAFKLNIKETNVAQLLGDISKLYKEIAMQRGNQIGIECDPAATIATDATVITLIVRNMVDNANKNTKNGNILLVHSVTNGGENIISIKDTGKGMDKETVEKVRELAFQETLKSSSLGFHFAFEFARLLNAVVSIESELGHGTTVAIHLPRGVAKS